MPSIKTALISAAELPRKSRATQTLLTSNLHCNFHVSLTVPNVGFIRYENSAIVSVSQR